MSKALKNGWLCEVLEIIFFFMSLKLSKIAKELEKLQQFKKFMNDKPPRRDRPEEKPSTGYRWQQEVNLLPSCTLVRRVGEHIFVSLQEVQPTKHVQEIVKIVHITNLEGFLWDDTPENVSTICIYILQILRSL